MYQGKEVKLKVFFDQETYHTTSRGASYVTATYATEEAEKFINRGDVEVLNIQYSYVKGSNSILVVYREVKDKSKRKRISDQLPGQTDMFDVIDNM
jgi:hypothetical protein